MEKSLIDLHAGDAKLHANAVEAADELGLSRGDARACGVDESVDRGFMFREAVGHAPNGVGEDPDASDVLPYVLTVNGRGRRGNTTDHALDLRQANNGLVGAVPTHAIRVALGALVAAHVQRARIGGGETHGS